MTEETMISSKSSKEMIASFFVKTFKIKEEIKNNLLKEDISGDVLYDLDESDFKSLGIKSDDLIKIKKYLNENKDKFEEKQINEIITKDSKPAEVAEFLERNLNFNGKLNNLDGKGLFEMNEERIKNIGLNIGQKKEL